MKTLKEKAESKKKASEDYIKKLQEYVLKAEKAQTYSIERFDLLLISLSSGALVLSVSLLKDVVKNFENQDLTLLKVSWILFVSTIVLNLLSQVTGYYANKYDILVTTECISREEGKPHNKTMESDEKLHWDLDSVTMCLNGVCLSTFILGVALLIRFMYLAV